MLRVLHIINTLGFGGAETRLLSLADGIGNDATLEIVQLGGAETLRPAFEAAGVKVHSIGLSRRTEIASGVMQLVNLIRLGKYDVVETHLVHAGVLGRLAATIATRMPLISTHHHAYHPKQRTIWYRLERGTRPLTDAIIAISGAVRAELARTGFSGRIDHIPTGIDIDRQKQMARGPRPMNAPYLLTVGHCRNGQKGHDIVLKAFAVIGQRFPNLRVVIVGDGRERQSLQTLAERLGVAERVWFAGERLDVPNLMSHCEVFVLPSRWEGLGRVVLEAMALRACVVASEVEGLAELVESAKSGILVKPEDTSALASAIALLLDDRDRRLSYGLHAETVVRERFSSREMCRRTLALYRELAPAALGPRRPHRLWRAARLTIQS